MTAPLNSVKPFGPKITTLWCVYFMIVTLFLGVSAPGRADDAVSANLPVFRHVDSVAKPPKDLAARKIVLLMDRDFPPFTYEGADGKTAGVSADIAFAACAELKLACTIVAKNFDELLPALLNNEGDVIISGLKVDETVLKQTAMTRPYFWSLGRFATGMGSQIRSSDARSLAGKRIGYVSNTSHAAWLDKYYSRSTLTAFASEAEMFAALQGSSVDAVFGDDLRVVYWLAGSASRGCCKALDGAYVDRNFFSHNLAFLARREDGDLVHGLDYALDRLQEKGISGQIFSRYLPGGLW